MSKKLSAAAWFLIRTSPALGSSSGISARTICSGSHQSLTRHAFIRRPPERVRYWVPVPLRAVDLSKESSRRIHASNVEVFPYRPPPCAKRRTTQFRVRYQVQALHKELSAVPLRQMVATPESWRQSRRQ